MTERECPMCGELMHLRETETSSQIPGTPGTKTMRSREWVCPECDYFEEVEDGED